LRKLRSLALAALLCGLPSVLAVAEEPPAGARAVGRSPPRGIYPRDDFDAAARVFAVKGDDVNLRGGPSVDYPSLGTLARGALVVLAPSGATGPLPSGDAAEWRRVLVPGGLPVHVFADLVEREKDSPLATIRGEDVLMRSEFGRARLPLVDQRLGQGDTLLVLGERTDEDGLWLRLLPPPSVFAWMHASLLTDVGTVQERRAALESAARARVDALSDGRTKAPREAWENGRRKAFRDRLAAWRAVLTSDAVEDQHVKACEAAVAEAPDEITKAEARSLVSLLERARVDRAARLRREKALADAAALDLERRRAEEERRRLDRDGDRLRSGDPPPTERRKPDVSGTVKVGSGRVLLLTDGRELELRSQKYRLEDYDGRSVRIWGKRNGSDGLGALRVDTLEVVPEKDGDGK
jgi:hypothetical protein